MNRLTLFLGELAARCIANSIIVEFDVKNDQILEIHFKRVRGKNVHRFTEQITYQEIQSERNDIEDMIGNIYENVKFRLK